MAASRSGLPRMAGSWDPGRRLTAGAVGAPHAIKRRARRLGTSWMTASYAVATQAGEGFGGRRAPPAHGQAGCLSYCANLLAVYSVLQDFWHGARIFRKA